MESKTLFRQCGIGEESKYNKSHFPCYRWVNEESIFHQPYIHMQNFHMILIINNSMYQLFSEKLITTIIAINYILEKTITVLSQMDFNALQNKMTRTHCMSPAFSRHILLPALPSQNKMTNTLKSTTPPMHFKELSSHGYWLHIKA
ncbi:hypothetical protein SO802_023196 [Lithocarpus litseifolius]|uniref:Uncharacterized protein n=1 Tax=Lithocarpus litseifolius TaxID=425828 RepID=A0AAW2C725_9ROSI